MNLKNLPQTLEDLSSIVPDNISIKNWSGAVNMVFVGEELVLIRRSDEMPSHKGQMGFLGGHRSEDDKSPIDNAFRELEEESGISRSNFTFKGVVTPVFTGKNKVIIPVVSKFNGSREKFISSMHSNGEWSSFVLAKFGDLKRVEKWQCAQVVSEKNYNIYFYSLLERDVSIFPKGQDDQKLILWGASAKMVWNFFDFVS